MLIGQTPTPTGCYVFLLARTKFAGAPAGLEDYRLTATI